MDNSCKISLGVLHHSIRSEVNVFDKTIKILNLESFSTKKIIDLKIKLQIMCADIDLVIDNRFLHDPSP